MKKSIVFVFFLSMIIACTPKDSKKNDNQKTAETPTSEIDKLLAKYTTFRLEADMSTLSENNQKMIPILIEAAKIMDDLFWYEAYGDKDCQYQLWSVGQAEWK